jgi:hypothetical protein
MPGCGMLDSGMSILLLLVFLNLDAKLRVPSNDAR